MKYTFETEINAPLQKVIELAGNPGNRKAWMEGLESYEPLSGTPGAVGSTSQLMFKTGGMEITMLGTVLVANLPNELTETFDASNVLTTRTARFRALSPQTTQYSSEQEFQFKGFVNKVVGFILQGEFRNQTLRHLENFKRFAERP